MNLRDEDVFKTDLTFWEIGPYHGALPAPMRLKLSLDGEVISKCQVETGFLHKGLEKVFELHQWRSIIPFSDHLDPECAVFGEMALCSAVEEIAEISVPQRAQYIRIILSELTRISAHLVYMVRIARTVGSETVIHYLLRDRERILDLFELIAGSRFSINFLRFGGVSADVTEGFMERILEFCELIRIRMKEYNDLFTYNYGFLKRSCHVAPISIDLVKKFGITGPNARAAGLAVDTRKDRPYSKYDSIDFSIPKGEGLGGVLGDVHDRFLIRLREVSQSTEILKQIIDLIPPGEFINRKFEGDFRVPSGEAYARVESPRGLLGCHVVSVGRDQPARVQFRVPTLANLMAIPDLVKGIRIEDLPVVLASLDLGVAEADR